MPQAPKRRRNPAAPYAKSGFQKYLKKELETQYKAAYQQKLRELEAQKREARSEREDKLRSARVACRLNLSLVREKADAIWQRERLAALEKRRATKRAEQQRCRSSKEQIRKEARAEIARLTQAQREERKLWREMRRSEQRSLAKARRYRSAKEARQESDDEVRANIDPDLIPYFEEIKRKVKGTPYMSRTEAFMHRVEEDPEAMWAAREAAADAILQEQLAEYYAEEEAVPF